MSSHKKNDEKTLLKLADGKGLFLMITKNGEEFWRFDYARPYTKKRNSISFDNYPIIGLAEARITMG
ncbi:MAG: hypothetical protein RSA09_14815 [Acinetobacter sp.]